MKNKLKGWNNRAQWTNCLFWTSNLIFSQRIAYGSDVRWMANEQIKPNFSQDNQYGDIKQPQKPVVMSLTLHISVKQKARMNLKILFRLIIRGKSALLCSLCYYSVSPLRGF